MSFHSTPREWPVPSAFIAASLAAKRPARCGAGFRRLRTIGNLAGSEHAVQESFAVALEHVGDARDVGGVEADAEDVHDRTTA